MMNIKTKWTEPLWLRVGYCNWEYFKDRKQICYKGKKIMFQWSLPFAQAVEISFVSVSHIIDK